MNKQVINSETEEWAEHEVAYSDCVAVDVSGAKRLFISGVVAEGESVKAQTWNVLEEIKNIVSEQSGGMEDIVRVRVYIAKPALDKTTLEDLHNIRSEFFIEDHLPASTLVEVENLVRDRYQIEIDADAIIPKEGWELDHS
jgi:enamine deaminase RidA (YjgF/YER057c/UK114 family)